MRAIALTALVALTACQAQHALDGGVDGLGYTASDSSDALAVADTDEPGAVAVRSVFHWDPARFDLTMHERLNGTAIAHSTSSAWVSRRAGSGMTRELRSGGRASSSADVSDLRGLGVRGVGGGGGGASGYGSGGIALESASAERAFAPPSGTRRPAPDIVVDMPQARGPLRAGSTDDNADYDEFLEFLDTWTGRPGVAGNHVPMDVSDRRFVRVLDAGGEPVPGARIAIVDRVHDQLVWNGTTYGDGLAPFYPHLAGADGAGGDWLVQAEVDGEILTRRWDGGDEVLTLQSDTWNDLGTVNLDVVFVIDTTGSMSDEIARIKQTLLSVTERVRGLDQQVDLRYGAVLYRDIGDEYLTRHTPLTHDVRAFDQMLQGIQAGGGGDGPESLNQGLSMAVGSMDWRDDAAKLAFLVADAPPHMDYQQDTTYADASRVALARGIRIHTVAASGLDDFGSLVFRQSAQLTRGEFVFIEYGSTAASAADHGVTGSVASNNLDAILYRKIEASVQGWGRPRS